MKNRLLMLGAVLFPLAAAAACGSGSRCHSEAPVDAGETSPDMSGGEATHPDTPLEVLDGGSTAPETAPKFVLKKMYVDGAKGVDGVSGMRTPGPVAVSDDGNTVLVGSAVPYLLEPDCLEEGAELATLVSFHRSGSDDPFSQADQYLIPSWCASEPRESDEVVFTPILRAVPGRSRALFTTMCGLKPVHRFNTVDWDPGSGKILSVQEPELAWNGCSTKDGCLEPDRGLRVAPDGRNAYLAASLDNQAGETWSWLLTIDLQAEPPIVVQAVKASGLRWFALGPSGALLFGWDAGSEDFAAWSRSPASGFLGEGLHADPKVGQWFDGPTFDEVVEAGRVDGWRIEPAGHGGEFVLGGDLWTDKFTDVFLHTLEVDTEALALQGVLSLQMYPGLSTTTESDEEFKPDYSSALTGFTASLDGRLVAYETLQLGWPPAILVLAWRGPDSHSYLPVRTWEIELPQWIFGNVWDPRYSLPPGDEYGHDHMAFSPDGRDLFSTHKWEIEGVPSFKPYYGCGGLLTHYQQVDSDEEGEQ